MPQAIIVGAGIGGLTAAVALHRKGWDVNVMEAATELRPVGKGIFIATNAMQVLQRMGLAKTVTKCGWPLAQIELRTVDEAVLSRFDLTIAEARFGHTMISIRRNKLVEILANELPSSNFHFGERCTEIFEDQNHVGVRLDDGTQIFGDCLIGADGIRSFTRQQLFPNVRLRYSGQTSYRGVSKMKLPAGLAHHCWEIWGCGISFGFAALHPEEVYWFAPITAPEGVQEISRNLQSGLSQRYKEFPHLVQELIAGSKYEEIIRADVYDFAPMAKWHRGRVVLIGDAAHAMTPNLGQGGAQAIEDGFVLAEALDQHSSVQTAFKKYQKRRQAKATRMVKASRLLGQMSHLHHPIARGIRNVAMRATPSCVHQRQLNRAYTLNY